MQREPIHSSTQRTLHQRLPPTVEADATIPLAGKLAECRAPFHRRGREPRQQLVALHRALGAVTAVAGPKFDTGDHQGGLIACAALRAPFDAFFDRVMVNAEDAALRQNRLAPTGQLQALMNRIADLSKLAV